MDSKNKYLDYFNEEEIDFINNSIKYRDKFDNEIINQNPNLELYFNGFNSINNTLNGFIEYLKELNIYISENNMKQSELKQIIKEEVRNVLNESDYDQAMQNLAKKADITLSKPEGKNKFRTEKEYKVGYVWRSGEEKESEIVTVKANTEEEAIAKAKEDAPRLARANGKFEVIKENLIRNQNLNEDLEQQAKDFVSKYSKISLTLK